MSVIIKGIPMPKNCNECPCYQDANSFYPFCMAIERQKYSDGDHLEKNGKGRHKDCPLFEIKDWRDA